MSLYNKENAQTYWNGRFNSQNNIISEQDPAADVSRFAETLRIGMKVLDLGCGNGRNSRLLAERGFQVYGVDISPNAITLCQKLFNESDLPGEFRTGALDDIPYPDEFFDAVVCNATIDHVPLITAQKAVEEIRRIKKPDGLIFITFDPPDTDQKELNAGNVIKLEDGTWFYQKGKYTGMFFRRYSDDEIKNLIGIKNIVSFSNSDDGDRLIVCN